MMIVLYFNCNFGVVVGVGEYYVYLCQHLISPRRGIFT